MNPSLAMDRFERGKPEGLVGSGREIDVDPMIGEPLASHVDAALDVDRVAAICARIGERNPRTCQGSVP